MPEHLQSAIGLAAPIVPASRRLSGSQQPAAPVSMAPRAGLSCPSYICDCRFLAAPAP